MSTNCNNSIKTPLVTVANIAAMASSAHHNHNRTAAATALAAPQKQPQHPITTTKMGSRRIFSAQFKLTVLDSYRMDADCKGNQRATARKYGIHRRQIQKWLQNETNLRSSVNNNNNNNSSDLQNKQNNNNNNNSSSSSINSGSHNNANKMSAMQTMNGGAALNGRAVNNLSLSAVDNVSAKHQQQRLLHDNSSATNKSILNQSTMSGNPTTNFHFTKNHQQQKHNANEINAMSLDMPRHSVAAAAAAATNTRNQNSGNNSKCATNAAAPTTNTSFSVSSTSTSPTLAPSSFVARPIPHSSNESYACASQRPPLRIVSPSYLLPSPQQANATHASNGIPMIEPSKAVGAFHSIAHYPATAYPHLQSAAAAAAAAAFHEINPMLYDSVQPALGMIPSIRHYLGTPHELQVASFAAATRAMPSAFENAFHLAPPPQNGYYDHPSAYDLYHSSYMPPPPMPPPSAIAMPATVMAAERVIIPKTEIITETKPNIEEIRANERQEALQSPIDLTLPGRQTPTDENRSPKPPRFSLPSPPVKAAYKIPDIPHTKTTEIESKPWDLRCTHKRKTEIVDDIDEGISVNGGEPNKTGDKTSASSPTPAKVVKLFKPYLMSSDDEDDESSGKKCQKSDQSHRDPIIWSSHTFFENNSSPTTITPFQSPIVNTQPQLNSSSYWSNHGSPVSGYDSASSTFSDCNCSDSNCQTKLASPAPTVASPSFSDDFTASPSSNSNTSNSSNSDNVATHATEPTVVSTHQPIKYIVPRRHILEKWSHEDEELQSSQFNQSQQDLIIMR